jgi:hypothetical protein
MAANNSALRLAANAQKQNGTREARLWQILNSFSAMLYLRRSTASTHLASNEGFVSISSHGVADGPEPQGSHLQSMRPKPQKGLHGISTARMRGLLALFVLLLSALGCNASDLLLPATPTPAPTRMLAPTWTPTPETMPPLIVVTPPQDGTPGMIIIQPTVDADRIVLQIPATDTPIPPPTTTPTPTFTPGPTQPGAITQPQSPLPGELPTPAGDLVPAPTAGVLLPTPTPFLPPTPTPPPTLTFTPAPTPTPFILVESGYVALRTGPGPEYPLVAQLGPNIPIAIISRNPQGTWYQICCVNGFSVWVAASHVRVVNDSSASPLVVAQGPPPPTPTFTPTWTPTVTPTTTATPFPFERGIGPQFFPTDNQFLTIWVKLFIGTPPLEQPAPGYCLEVKFEGFGRTATNAKQPSTDAFEWSAPPGAGNRVQYNLKYEYLPPDPKAADPNTTDTRLTLLGTGTWTTFVTDCAGRQLSDAVTFTTSPSNPNREIYIGWVRVR